MIANFEEVERETKYTLLTNIQFVQRTNDNMRIGCHALLFTEGGIGMFEKDYSLRGFGTEAAWDVLKIWLDKDKHFPFAIDPRDSQVAMIMRKDGMKPIFSGSNVTLKDGTEFFLQADDSSRPLDVYKQVGDICHVWEVLYRKTAEYWHAPYMPRLTYGPPSMAERRY